MTRVAFIGVGRMGGPMAGHLLTAGHEVLAVDPDAGNLAAVVERGATAMALLDAVADADVVITSLPAPPDVEQVYLGEGGIIAAARPGATLIDTSTSSPTLARRLATAAAARGVDVLDAPVSGGPTGAQAATLAIMVGGDDAAFERVESLLGALSGVLRHMGGAGTGQATKLVNNLLAGVYMTAIAEAVALAEREHLDPTALFDVLTNGTGDSRPLRTRFPIPGARPETPASNGWAPMFPVDLIAKDLRLAIDAAREVELELPMVEAALVRYELAADQRGGNLDYSVVSDLFRVPPTVPAL